MKSVVDEWNRPSGRVASWNAFDKKKERKKKIRYTHGCGRWWKK